MELWEMMCTDVETWSVYVYTNDDDVIRRVFRPDGKPKSWETRPSIQPYVNKRRKKQKPLADIGHLTVGTFILSEKAHHVLGSLFLQFGQLLEVDCEGETKFYFNVTNLISFIDFEQSSKIGHAVTKPVILPAAIPSGIQIFKDPLTIGTAIYLTTEAKVVLESLIRAEKLTGLAIFKAGEGPYQT